MGGCCYCCNCCSLTGIDDAWFRLRTACRRRRNSYKLYLFHLISTAFSILTFSTALTLYLVVWSQMSSVSEDCTVTPALTNKDFKNYTLTNEQAIACDYEPFGAAACELQDLRNVLDFVLVNGVTNAIQLLFSGLLCRTFHYFSNLPQEKMHYGSTSRLISCGGCLAKWCPWVGRSLHLFQIVILWTIWGIMTDNTCRGELALTYNCANFEEGCGYNKLKNCQFYYTFCSADETLAQQCFNVDGRSEFSGRMDVRLLSFSTCARCAVLAADKANPIDSDEFWLLDEEDRYDPSVYPCSQALDTCFYTTEAVWSTIACDCPDFKNYLNLTEDTVSTWWTARSASCSRRLEGQHKQSQEVFRDGAKTEEILPDQMLVDVETDAADMPGFSKRETEMSLPDDPWGWRMEEAASRRRREEAGRPDRGLLGLGLDSQACSWAPQSISEFFFPSGACHQAGSFVYRLGLIYVYLSGSLMIVTIGVGQTVRVMCSTEPWFFSPSVGKESWFKKFLRMAGP